MEITSVLYPAFLIVFLAVYFALSKSRLQIYAILAASLIYMTYSSGISGTLICMLLCLFLWLIGKKLKGSRPLFFLSLFLVSLPRRPGSPIFHFQWPLILWTAIKAR